MSNPPQTQHGDRGYDYDYSYATTPSQSQYPHSQTHPPPSHPRSPHDPAVPPQHPSGLAPSQTYTGAPPHAYAHNQLPPPGPHHQQPLTSEYAQGSSSVPLGAYDARQYGGYESYNPFPASSGQGSSSAPGSAPGREVQSSSRGSAQSSQSSPSRGQWAQVSSAGGESSTGTQSTHGQGQGQGQSQSPTDGGAYQQAYYAQSQSPLMTRTPWSGQSHRPHQPPPHQQHQPPAHYQPPSQFQQPPQHLQHQQSQQSQGQGQMQSQGNYDYRPMSAYDLSQSHQQQPAPHLPQPMQSSTGWSQVHGMAYPTPPQSSHRNEPFPTAGPSGLQLHSYSHPHASHPEYISSDESPPPNPYSLSASSTPLSPPGGSEDLDEGLLPIGSRDRRRAQNKIAQRAFRERAKIQAQEVGAKKYTRSLQDKDHMADLESLTTHQAAQIEEMKGMIEKLRRDNDQLRQARGGDDGSGQDSGGGRGGVGEGDWNTRSPGQVKEEIQDLDLMDEEVLVSLDSPEQRIS